MQKINLFYRCKKYVQYCYKCKEDSRTENEFTFSVQQVRGG